MRLHIRDREMLGIFIVGIGLSFYIALSGAQLLNEWYGQISKVRQESAYQNSMLMDIYATNNLNNVEIDISEMKQWEAEYHSYVCALLNYLAGQRLTTYITNLALCAGNAGESYNAYVILSYREQWFKPLIEGRYPTRAELAAGHRLAMVSQSMLPILTNTQGKRYINMNGMEYEVVGIYETYDTIEEEPVDICLFYDMASDYGYPDMYTKLSASLMYAGYIRICVGSNKGDVGEVREQIHSWIERQPAFLECDSSLSAEAESVSLYAFLKAFVMAILFIVSIINITQITRLWLLRRKRDMVILRVYGCSIGRIACRLTGEVARWILLTVPFVLLVDILLFHFLHLTNASIIENEKGLVLFSVLIICMIFIMMLTTLEQIRRIDVAQGLREL